MPHLDWKNQTNGQKVIAHPEHGSELTLALSLESRDQLVPALARIFEQKAPGELRVDLPANWIMFWKLRETESRLLLAHPMKDEWVTTLALEEALGLELIAKLRELGAGGRLSVRELAIASVGRLGSVSNVDVVFSLN